MGHGLRSMAAPLITALGPMSVSLMTGLLHRRADLFDPGSGRLFVQSVYARDYGMIMGGTLLFAVLDLLREPCSRYRLRAADPRIRLNGKNRA